MRPLCLCLFLLALLSPSRARNCTIEDVRPLRTGAADAWRFAGCTHVQVRGAKLFDKHVVAMAKLLEGNEEVVTVDFSHNHIADDGAIALARLLEHKKAAPR